MLCRILRGPRFGEEVHLPKSQETNLAILLNDIEVVTDDTPTQNVPQHPPQGWYLEKVGQECGRDRTVIVFRDGNGGKTFYEKPPGPTKSWHYDPETGSEGYIDVPSTCPQSLIDRFNLLTAAPGTNPEWQAEQQRRTRYELERQQKEQSNLALGFLGAHGVQI